MKYEQVREYLDTLKQPPTSWQVEMIDEAIKDRIPIMERDGIDFLKQMLRLKRPDRILEIGSAIGYSALQMIDAVPSARVITIERDQARAKRAKYYFNRYNQDQTIELIEGDAFDVAEQVRNQGPYDVIFIDAAKGQYQRFFELYSSMLTDNGVIITDNVLFHGYVINAQTASKRIGNLAKKINTYNQWLVNQTEYDTEFFPIGDGIAISVKKP